MSRTTGEEWAIDAAMAERADLTAMDDFVGREFGLRGFPGRRFRMDALHSYIDDSHTQQVVIQVLVIGGWADGQWADFSRESLAQFLSNVIALELTR